MNRLEVTEKIISTKVAKGIQWADVAKKVGQSKEWTTALCLGQMTASPEQAKILGKIFGLNAEEQKGDKMIGIEAQGDTIRTVSSLKARDEPPFRNLQFKYDVDTFRFVQIENQIPGGLVIGS